MNFIEIIVKIIESPNYTIRNENVKVIKFRVEIPQFKNKTIIKLVFWGNLGDEVKDYYQINDYIIVEGYLSTCNKDKINYSSIHKIKEITVLKIYPLLVHLNKKL